MSEVRMTQPTEIILLIDEEKNNDGYWYAVNGTDSTDQLTQAHNKGGNLLYADGHAKYILYDKFPVDLNGGALKTRTTESPRFYDLSFGATGFWNPTPASAFGSCVAP